jgi:hypothetical protein
MQSARTAIDVMVASGDRTPARLRALVEHYARFYGENSEIAFDVALKQALVSVIGFQGSDGAVSDEREE